MAKKGKSESDAAQPPDVEEPPLTDPPTREALKEEILYSVLLMFGKECEKSFDKSARKTLDALLQRTVWAAVDSGLITEWMPEDQDYVRDLIQDIAKAACGAAKDAREPKIKGANLFREADPRIKKKKKEAQQTLARLQRMKAARGDDQLAAKVGYFAMLTKYCDDYPE